MKKVLLFMTCCIAAAVYGSDVLYYPEFEDSVSFYASFDAASPDADISEGREKPVNVVGKLSIAPSPSKSQPKRLSTGGTTICVP